MGFALSRVFLVATKNIFNKGLIFVIASFMISSMNTTTGLKYTRKEKVERNKRIREFAEKHKWTLEELAKRYGVSRQRIWQILNEGNASASDKQD